MPSARSKARWPAAGSAPEPLRRHTGPHRTAPRQRNRTPGRLAEGPGMSPLGRRTSGDWLNWRSRRLLIMAGAKAGRDGVDGSGAGGSIAPASGTAMIGTSITSSTGALLATIGTSMTGVGRGRGNQGCLSPASTGVSAPRVTRRPGRPRRSPSSTATCPAIRASSSVWWRLNPIPCSSSSANRQPR